MEANWDSAPPFIVLAPRMERNIVCHEYLSGKLRTDGLYTLLQPLLYYIRDHELNLFFLFDSTCTLAMLNPVLDLKNMLINNAIQSFKEGVSRISIQFPNANIMIGHLSAAENPAYGMKKLFKDPIAIINNQHYREGQAKFGSL